jgi:hypothetical protein
LFKALRRCDNASTRRAIIEVLVKIDYASRAFLRSELRERDLPAIYLIEMLRILSRVGGTNRVDLAAPLLEHVDPRVRIEALGTTAALDTALGEERALAALSDADRKVRETALKALFDAASTAPALFDFCGRILSASSEADPADEATARLICFRLAGYARGEARERSVALLRIALGDAGEASGRWWSSLKRAVTGDSKHVSVLVAACQALGRLRAAEASGALENASRQTNPKLKHAAQQALERIRNG